MRAGVKAEPSRSTTAAWTCRASTSHRLLPDTESTYGEHVANDLGRPTLFLHSPIAASLETAARRPRFWGWAQIPLPRPDPSPLMLFLDRGCRVGGPANVLSASSSVGLADETPDPLPDRMCMACFGGYIFEVKSPD